MVYMDSAANSTLKTPLFSSGNRRFNEALLATSKPFRDFVGSMAAKGRIWSLQLR